MNGYHQQAYDEGRAARLAWAEPRAVPVNPYGRNRENEMARQWDHGFATAWAHTHEPETASLAAAIHRQACLDGKNGAAYLVFHATRDLSAFSLSAFPVRALRTVSNQYGVRLTFDDGTALFITRGAPRRQRVYDAAGVGVAARPAA